MRDTTAAAKELMKATDAWLREIAMRDPDMIRDVAAALTHARSYLGRGCGAVDCVNACDGEFTHETCPDAIAARAR